MDVGICVGIGVGIEVGICVGQQLWNNLWKSIWEWYRNRKIVEYNITGNHLTRLNDIVYFRVEIIFVIFEFREENKWFLFSDYPNILYFVIMNHGDTTVLLEVLDGIIAQYRSDIAKEIGQQIAQIDEQCVKMKQSRLNEEKQVSDLKLEIETWQNKLQKTKLKYLSAKIKKEELLKTQEEKRRYNQDLINIYFHKISQYKIQKQDIEKSIDTEKNKFIDKKNQENNKLAIERDIYNDETKRVKTKKADIETTLKQNIVTNIKDLETFSQKINQCNIEAKALKEELRNMEVGDSQARRNIIRNNTIYLRHQKNFKKVKKSLQYQIANHNLDLQFDQNQFEKELSQLEAKNQLEEQKHQEAIQHQNQLVSQLEHDFQIFQNNVVNPDSKTWQIQYQNLSQILNDHHTTLTNLITAFNIYLSQYQKTKYELVEKHKYQVEIKEKAIQKLTLKINQMKKAESAKVNKLLLQHQNNRSKINDKVKQLHTVITKLQTLEKKRYQHQKAIQQYEQTVNHEIAALGQDLDRALDRYQTISKRINKTITKFQNKCDSNLVKHQTQLDDVLNSIKNCSQMISSLENNNRKYDKDIQQTIDTIHSSRVEIKDLERQIASKENQLDRLQNKVSARIDNIKERENDLIGQKMKIELDYANKLHKLDQAYQVSDTEKLDIINQLIA